MVPRAQFLAPKKQTVSSVSILSDLYGLEATPTDVQRQIDGQFWIILDSSGQYLVFISQNITFESCKPMLENDRCMC